MKWKTIVEIELSSSNQLQIVLHEYDLIPSIFKFHDGHEFQVLQYLQIV